MGKKLAGRGKSNTIGNLIEKTRSNAEVAKLQHSLNYIKIRLNAPKYSQNDK